jgi:signal transduction histidine kinase
MGNHGAAGARARAVTADSRARKSTDVNAARSRPLSLSNWPVSRRLFAVIAMALVMGLVFGGLRVASAESSAAQFGRVSQLATLGQRLTVLTQDLQDERDLTLSFLLSGKATKLTPLYSQTDNAIQAVQQSASAIGSAFPANIQAQATTVLADISSSRMKDLRSALDPKAPLGELAVIANYGAIINDMITLADQVAQGVSDASLASDVRAFNGLALAKEQASQQRALLNYTFSTRAGPNDGNVQVDANTLPALQLASDNEFTDESAFQTAATADEQAFLTNTLSSPAAVTDVAYAQELELSIFSNVGATPAVSLLGDVQQGIGPQAGKPPVGPFKTLTQGQRVWDAGTTDQINGMQATENLIAGNILNRANQLQSGARQSALITGIITGVVLLLVLLAALLVARSLVLPLRRLRVGALDVASVQLPERVRQLSESPESATSLDVEPIDVLTGDEIGQVARAFDQVHQEAVRLAGDEALLRTSFNAMFVNLSRRSQSLQERLARMIDSLEQNEDDPDRLSNLFAMDHLVTRMRRNSENLLLLAGHEGARKWSESVTLADVARAATSEIEQYNRVTLNIQPGISVIGQAVSDVVHLLAELIENATLYSPKDTQVQVAAQELTSGGVLMEVTDKGIGVSEARLAEMNWRLDNPPTMDVSVSRHMGLFAVARLAERHRVRVRLRPASPQGLTALVWLPDSVLERTARAVYGGTGGWQPVGGPAAQPVTAAPQGGFQQARRIPGQFTNGQVGAPQQSYGRHSLPARAAADDSYAPDRPDTMTTPAQSGYDSATRAETGAGTAQATDPVPTSNWFRSRRTTSGSGTSASSTPGSGAGSGDGGIGIGGAGNAGVGNADARPFVTPGQPGGGFGDGDSGTGGGWDSGTGGWPTARNPGDIAAEPIRGEETSAGLPMRVPKANLIPGSAADAPAGGGNSRAARGTGSSQEAQTLSAPLPQRSPDMARSRLSGFQRGARRAEGQAPRAGEGTDR